MKVLILYPNIPLMFSPALSVGIFNTICKREGAEVSIFETTYYSDQFTNRHILLSASGANKGESVRDQITMKDPKDMVKDWVAKVESFNPDLILVSMAEDTYHLGIKLLEAIKDKNIPNIVGGVFARDAKDILLKHDVVTSVCHHEGEYVIRDAIRALKNNETIEHIKGTTYRYADHAHANEEQPLCNIAEYPPDFDLFDDKRWARPMGGRIFKRTVPMETYRGCPYNCTYCNSPSQRAFSKDNNQGNFMRRKPAEYIEKELVSILENHDPEMILFIDDSFLARPKKEIEEFSNMWAKYKIPFWMNTRIENCTPDVLEMIKHAGCYRMSFGLESGNEEYRRNILSRNVSNEKYLEHFEYINESNIPYSLNIILGMPFETPELVEDSVRLARAARGYDALTLSHFVPYTGTGLRKLAVENNFVDPDRLSTGGGILGGEWSLKMPKPYLQKKEVYDYLKIFAMLAFYPDEKWPEIKASLKDEKLYNRLLNTYKETFYSEYQEGGAERIARLSKNIVTPYKKPKGVKVWAKGCVKHDESQTMRVEVVS